jgi:hypothetical protein
VEFSIPLDRASTKEFLKKIVIRGRGKYDDSLPQTSKLPYAQKLVQDGAVENRWTTLLNEWVFRDPEYAKHAPRGDWCSHIVSHFGAAGPPSQALCIFCDSKFDWDQCMTHIADHFRLGWTIDTSRPTFAVFRHMHTTPRDHSLPAFC